MNKLLEDFKQLQLKRRIKTDILVEVRYSNNSIMTKLVQFIHDHEILLIPIEIEQSVLIRLNEYTIIGGCTAMNTAKIAINHRNFGDVILIFKNTNIRETVLMDLLKIYGDHSSSDSGASV